MKKKIKEFNILIDDFYLRKLFSFSVMGDTCFDMIAVNKFLFFFLINKQYFYMRVGFIKTKGLSKFFYFGLYRTEIKFLIKKIYFFLNV